MDLRDLAAVPDDLGMMGGVLPRVKLLTGLEFLPRGKGRFDIL
jgi:hypothetical protein